MKKTKKNRFFLAGMVLLAFWAITSCFSLQSIDSTKPVQIGRLAFSPPIKNDIVGTIISDRFDDDPAKLTSAMMDVMEKNYNLFVQAARKEGITLDVQRLHNEFLNPDFPKKFKRTLGPVYEFTVEPQDNVYASCQITVSIGSNNELILTEATLTFVQGKSLSPIIGVK